MRLHPLAAALLIGLAACRPAPAPLGGGESHPHVLLLHLDGYRGDVTRSLLDSGQLPYLGYLVSRGRVSFEAATVDKSETMKVIQSYLTSQLDTTVVGWWQFDRSDFRFRNYWLDPAEVLSYALGLGFPAGPTIQDFLASRGENLVSGMSLARRGVPFQNYGRAYLEGIEAVSSLSYHRQADATVRDFLAIHRRIVDRGEPSPALSTLLLAAADEFAHARGVSVAGGESERCFTRDEEADETVFLLLDEDGVHPFGGGLARLESRYFTRVRRSFFGRKVEEICIALPFLDTSGSERRRAHPSYVLAMLALDIQVGYVIEGFRSIRFGPGGERRVERQAPLFDASEAATPTDSLFARTLFLVFGDHGMVDTPRGMTGSESFIDLLNRRLALATHEGAGTLPADAELGIDYQRLPRRLAHPEIFTDWQSESTRRAAREAGAWAEGFFDELRGVMRDGLHERYWWLFFLRSLLIDPKLDSSLGTVADESKALFRKLYLRGVPEYRSAETEGNRKLFDRHVRLVYGGGALNNAELFLPACDAQGSCSWSRRPSYEEIVSHRGGSKSTTTLLEALRENEGVGLVFVRKNNELFSPGAPLPERVEIEVQDRDGNRAAIAAFRDPRGELVFFYRTDPGSERDPLGYGRWGRAGAFGTYQEWNDRTLESDYVNVVGGIGSYLFSSNPAIGDVLVMHGTGWNFGDNLGGHGGVHRFEKTTLLLASGPGIEPGELRAPGRYRTELGGALVADGTVRHAPTLLDLAPTALDWLGYSGEDLERFGREGFREYLDHWIRSQRGEILSHLDGVSSLERAKARAKVEGMSLAPLGPRIDRLLGFVDSDREAMLERIEERPLLGNPLELR